MYFNFLEIYELFKKNVENTEKENIGDGMKLNSDSNKKNTRTEYKCC